ncbi:MAG: DNA topoisomerase 4 subunit A [Anaerolineae bacterium]|nr:DNA topoisomerase 4 subunit A [Anaerolineae bacterium]
MEIGMVRKVDIDDEMQQSYLDYAMSVIVARALPDARDGLKPVQRRTLYAMYDMGLRADSDFKKSARIVGEVLGKYHPHGDMAVYESMARMAQDFSMRYPIVSGQGNFGSIDGDPPAAMRYTEARLQPYALEIINQLDRDTVDFTTNFDETLQEPQVLPAAVPNLLVNGANGIAVGMATNIPPHNLVEVIDALIFMLQGWENMDDIGVQDLMRFIQGPDFPTGGILMRDNAENDLLTAYGSGRGKVVVRGRVQYEEIQRGRSRLLITELPYQTNKSSLIEKIAELVRNGIIDSIADLRDESDRDGLRIVIELNKNADPDKVLLMLYKHTPLQVTFGINILALVDGEPRLLNLKHALRVYLDHRLTVIRRRSEYDLRKARARIHILEGFRIALANLDAIIATIKASPDVDTARSRMIKRFKMTELQAQAVLDMQLRRLAALERKKIELEYRDLTKVVKELESLLRSPKKIRLVAIDELTAIRNNYRDRRRTTIISIDPNQDAKSLLTAQDLTPEQVVWVSVSGDGMVTRTLGDKAPRLSGKAAPRWLIRASTHHMLYLICETGRAAAVPVEMVPESDQSAAGVHYSKLAPLAGEPLVDIISIPRGGESQAGWYLACISRMGMVKKSAITELPVASGQAFSITKINPGDSLIKTMLTHGDDDVCLFTAQGMAIRFAEDDVRAMGLVAAGVSAIKLAPADYIVGAEVVRTGVELVIFGSHGIAWRLPFDDFPRQGRNGMGVGISKLPQGVRIVGSLAAKRSQNVGICFQRAVAKSIKIADLTPGKRMRSGSVAASLRTNDQVVAVVPVTDWYSAWIEKRRKPGRARG